MSLPINWQPGQPIPVVRPDSTGSPSVYQSISVIKKKLSEVGFVAPNIEYKYNHIIVIVHLPDCRKQPYEQMLSSEVCAAIQGCQTKDGVLKALDNLEMEMMS